ncbi:uncharacterized protein LOC129725879 [Wyeomyia smithii]|uniref:uncharacterized protein LOC129725879 n=1 Tax=Wyeomyia smithii TaxID=174621 RepID=UPI002467BA82|nr:uncharacterized protein LOC129725879 [Wyeomyia smithii]
MDDEKLIELVRSHPVLYDLGEARYLDSRHKTVIWNRIAAELEAEANDCKSRWSNIRDQYRKSLKKETTRSGQAATQIRPYKYKHLLRFLKPTFEERATMSNIEPEEPVDDSWTEPAGDISSPLWSPQRNPSPLQNPSPPRFTSPLRNRSSPRKSTPTSKYAPSPPLKIPPLRPAKPRALTPPPPQEKHPDKKPIENHSISFSYNDFFLNFKFNMNKP